MKNNNETFSFQLPTTECNVVSGLYISLSQKLRDITGKGVEGMLVMRSSRVVNWLKYTKAVYQYTSIALDELVKFKGKYYKGVQYVCCYGNKQRQVVHIHDLKIIESKVNIKSTLGSWNSLLVHLFFFCCIEFV